MDDLTRRLAAGDPGAQHTILMTHVDAVLAKVRAELDRALTKHPPTTPGWNPHCGKAVIEEELDELWELVKLDHGRTGGHQYVLGLNGKKTNAEKEAIQISAMGVRYVLECVMRIFG